VPRQGKDIAGEAFVVSAVSSQIFTLSATGTTAKKVGHSSPKPFDRATPERQGNAIFRAEF